MKKQTTTEKIIKERFLVEITHETLDVPILNTCYRRSIDIHSLFDEDNDLKHVFSESELIHGVEPTSRNGIAGAVNLLYGLLLGHENTYYVNDEHSLSNKMSKNSACCCGNSRKDTCRIGKRLNILGKFRLKLSQFKVKFFNIFK